MIRAAFAPEPELDETERMAQRNMLFGQELKVEQEFFYDSQGNKHNQCPDCETPSKDEFPLLTYVGCSGCPRIFERRRPEPKIIEENEEEVFEKIAIDKEAEEAFEKSEFEVN